jgi:deazaflavin-dependent oxidoreductase (nitroreductase family)
VSGLDDVGARALRAIRATITNGDDVSDFNQNVIEEFRANGGVVGGPFEGAPMILVTHKGAKSGIERTTPLVHTRDGDDVVIIASMGGAPTSPQWYHNIIANPEVTVEIGTERFRARATEATGAERDRLFAAQAALMPNFDEYQAKTSRVIPVLVLRRIED